MSWHNYWMWLLDLGWLAFLLILLRHFWLKRTVLTAAQSWLKTKGYITACEWTEVGHSRWPKIEYTYEVNEKELVGEYLFLDTTHNNPNSKYSRHVAYNVAVCFKEEREIEVYYNPNNPHESALDIAIPSKLNTILCIISVLIVLHLGIIAWRLL